MRIKLVLMMLAVVLLGVNGFAAGPDCESCDVDKKETKQCAHHEKMAKKLAKKLRLSEDQSAKINQIREEYSAKKNANRSLLKASVEKMKTLKSAESKDFVAIERLMNETGPLKTQVKVNEMKKMAAVNAILTPDQQKKMKRLHKKKHRKGYKKSECKH